MKTPQKIFAVVADSTGVVEYSTNSAQSAEDMFYRIPDSFRSAFSLWEFVPSGTFDQYHLNQKPNRRKTR